MDQIYAYVDGAYLRRIGKDLAPNDPWLEPWDVCKGSFRAPPPGHPSALGTIDRLNFYDVEEDEDVARYLAAVEAIPHCSVRPGSLRPGKKKREQKGVDVLLAVEMLHDAQAGNFSAGILMAGDADFVPLVDEVRRHGVIVIVVAQEKTLAGTLRVAADEVWPIDPTNLNNWAMKL